VPVKVNRIVSLMNECTTAVLTLKAGDKLVGLDTSSLAYLPSKKAWLDNHPVASVGQSQEPNIEQILTLKPDVILYWGGYGGADEIQRRSGVPVVCLHSFTTIAGMKANYDIVGRMLGLEARVEELMKYADARLSAISAATAPPVNKPKVHLLFWSFWNGVSRIPIYYDPVDIAGGFNIAKGQDPNVYGYSVKVPVEQVVTWNPDFIFIHAYPAKPSVSIETILNDPRMKTVSAVKTRNVYYTLGMSSGWHYPRVLVETMYMAKILHPDLFKSLDPQKEGDAVYEKFYGVSGLWTAHANSEGWLEYYARIGISSK